MTTAARSRASHMSPAHPIHLSRLPTPTPHSPPSRGATSSPHGTRLTAHATRKSSDTLRLPHQAKRRALEEDFLAQLALAGLPVPTPQYVFAQEAMGRRWRFDGAYPSLRLAFELDGGVTPYRDPQTGELRQGRHNTPLGYEGDCEKMNAAAILGWRVLHFTRRMVDDGRALATLTAALTALGWVKP